MRSEDNSNNILYTDFFFTARRERNTIIQGLRSFAASTCIRFTPHNGQRDFVNIQSLSGYEWHNAHL